MINLSGSILNSFEIILTDCIENLLADKDDNIWLNAGINLIQHTAIREIRGKICSVVRLRIINIIVNEDRENTAINSRKSFGTCPKKVK